jgi:hypothetical protein
MNKIVKSYLLAQLADIDDALNEAECKFIFLIYFNPMNKFNYN